MLGCVSLPEGSCWVNTPWAGGSDVGFLKWGWIMTFLNDFWRMKIYGKSHFEIKYPAVETLVFRVGSIHDSGPFYFGAIS